MSNSDKSKKTQNTFFAFIWALVCVEQDQKKKKSENIRPHEKKIEKKNHVFKPKNVKNYEIRFFFGVFDYIFWFLALKALHIPKCNLVAPIELTLSRKT